MKKIIAFILFNTLLYALTKPLIFDKEIRGNADNSTDYTYTFESKTYIHIPKIIYSCPNSYSSSYSLDSHDVWNPRFLPPGKHKLTFRCSGSYVLKVDTPTELYVGGENFTSYVGPTSLITRGKFLSQLTNFNTNNLESLIEPGMNASTSNILHFGSAGNAEVFGSESKFLGGCKSPQFSYTGMIQNYVGNDNQWWTTSGTNYFRFNCRNYFKFTKPISAFGFYGIDTNIIHMYINHVDGTRTYFLAGGLNYQYTSGLDNSYDTEFVGVITRTLGKAIKSITIDIIEPGYIVDDAADPDARFDDFVVASLGNIRDGDMDGDGVINSRDPFPTNPSESVDTDHDGIGNNADKDDDGDGISDILEAYYHLNPLDPSDAGKDPDGDGFSNVIEIELGFNPYSSGSHPKWAPIMMNDITIFIPYK